MGEIADDHVEAMLAGGMFRFARPRNQWCATCKICGKQGLKWRAEDDGWRLFENERVEHNRLKPHLCGQQSAQEAFSNV
ncbi:hypothetical protein BLA39750_02187 [Burkholderia lata]|uniref:Uncharacterized protein n=1 Tax=Burkholderia lata (strain ATCC 17760 / DSM 23089 / LMG 22485 / NCIMB 9086 / R18194 / 383) TaxID=482957 RepID=A0A6P2W740_BURL3|nr:hypothetical protein [Burkholderia lata]VWC95407.1 hypothetical protein BLA39750_02187 [Burkholderia lata]